MIRLRTAGLFLIATVGCSRADARIVPGGDVARGKAAIQSIGCGACHVIDGIADAHGQVGPPLSGIAGRSMVGGVLPNTPENMIRWIEDAPSISPQTAMPDLGVTAQQARDIAAYLYTQQ
jgi:cytochrome c2